MPTASIVRADIRVRSASSGAEREESGRRRAGRGKGKAGARRQRARKAGAAQPKVDRHAAPPGMSLEQWQAALRRQYGRDQPFKLSNLGSDPVFSEFHVENPVSKGVYRVVIRGLELGRNSCTCPDFETNALGTCKHIEFTLAKLERRRGGKAALAAGFTPPFSEIVLRHGARREVIFRPGSECPRPLLALAERFFDDAGVLREVHDGDLDRFLAAAQRARHPIRCAAEALSFVAEVRDAAERRRRIARAFPRGARSAGLARVLRTKLYEYQREGALFAAAAGRCLIGDEMGLGKTVQAIAAAEIMARHLDVERVLVVCPTSLKHQWAREIERFTARSALVIGGGRGRRRERYAEPSFFKIVNYDTIHRDLDLIAAWRPDLVVLDEAQRIKNWATRAARSVKRIVSPYAIVLTGTPLENRLEELVSIVDFVDRHRLGPTYRLLAEHQVRDADSGRVVGYTGLDRIGRTLSPILLRRRKRDVAIQLPERVDKNWFVPMTPQQMAIHAENLEAVATIVARWHKFRFLSEADRVRLMVALQNMRMVCDSTHLVDQATEHGTKPDEIATLVGEILEEPEAKVVVFSQWVRMHEILMRRLEARRIAHAFFHGSLSTDERAAVIDRFRDDPACRVFLSTDAGGVGLNLQQASVVINADLPWNPAVLEQRIGRVHRLGQPRMVQVFNFISRGGIEEGMLEVLRFKRSLFSGALDGETSEVFLGASSLGRFMKAVEHATAAVSQLPADESEDDAAESTVEAAANGSGEVAASPEAPAGTERRTVPSRELDSAGADGNGTSSGARSGSADRPSSVQTDVASLIQQGLALLAPLFAEAAARDGAGRTPASSPAQHYREVVRRDPTTDEPYLHIPMPGPEALETILTAATRLLERLRGKRE